MRVRFGKAVGAWFDYLLVSPDEMREIVEGADWHIEELIEPGQPNYIATLGKNHN
jgi:hypothetical protein